MLKHIDYKTTLRIFASLLLLPFIVNAQNTDNLPVREYELVIDEGEMNITGKTVKGMTVNGSIPGPTLRFKEGEYAIIYVKNNMKVETSVHWHGLILPNFYDGVPYLTTPPIKPGATQKYEFPLKQSGTYWYHSHTMLQEQSGVYGSIVIEPQEQQLDYNKELVIVLSDWTNEKPQNLLRNLKRGNEWYNIRKGTATPLNRVIARGGLSAQINFWKQRMESADIADVYYPAFLSNGKPTQHYKDLKAGDKVRLRIINASSSSQYWLTFGGDAPTLVSADGVDVVPVKHNKTFIAIAETYDFIITIPKNNSIEMRAMAQDGSGYSSTYFGSGDTLKAEVLPRPDKIGMMMKMAKMDMRMGAPATKLRHNHEEPKQMMQKWGMKMNDNKDMQGMDMSMHQDMKMGDTNKKSNGMSMSHSMNMYSEYNYDYLRSPTSTAIDTSKPLKEVMLNLTGNMWRYIWSMNGVPLSEADKIKIEKGQRVRITLNNLTMMHHPMHLHGHFFRVINKNGEYSPLKHTVNVPPMQKVVIEFDAKEEGDWFFHCHVLYHMMSGMARIYSYGTPRDPRMANVPLQKLIKEGNHFYTWSTLDVASHMTGLNMVSSNQRNQFNLNAEYGWNKNFEGEFSYERYLYDYFRVFAGVNVENENRKSLGEIETTVVGGFRFFTPYMFNLDVRIDNKLRPQISLSRSVMIFPRTILFGSYEYRADLGWVSSSPTTETKKYTQEVVWNAGLEYILSRNFSVTASYDNRFGAGAGLSVRY